MELIRSFMDQYLAYVPHVGATDVIEILIISFAVYQIMVWLKNTRAWTLVKGVVVIMIFVLLAAVFNMNTILWIFKNLLMYGAFALVVVLQPELRSALEKLGNREFLAGFFNLDSSRKASGLFSDRTIKEISRACMEMGRARTGALIVVQQNESLEDFERTGIEVDGILTSQLLINIFEHNTPLHDGAVIVRGDRVTSATCYLPLSDNMSLSKDLGTRHRAGIGVSEITDSMTVIVSEETGSVRTAYRGELSGELDAQSLEENLRKIQNKVDEEKERKRFFIPKKNGKTHSNQVSSEQENKE